MLKIKTLKELIEPKANKLGLSFEEVLTELTLDQRFEKLISQIEKYAVGRSSNADTRLLNLFNESEFIKVSETNFYVTPNEKDLLRYKKILLELYNNGEGLDFNHHRFIVGKDTDYYKNLENNRNIFVINFKKQYGYLPDLSFGLNNANKGFDIYQKIMKYNVQHHNFYFIDHKEENLIKEYYAASLKNNIVSNSSLHEIQFTKFNQMLSNGSYSIIECIFDHIRSIKFNYVAEDFTYDNVKAFFDTNNFNKYLKESSDKRKSIMKFDMSRWEYSKSNDLRITNFEELKIAIDVYVEYLSKVNLFYKLRTPPKMSAEYIKSSINNMTMNNVLEINKIVQNRIAQGF